MRTALLKATASAWTTQAFPNRNNSGSTRLFLSGGTTHRRGYLWFPPPVPPGSRILEATLRLTFVKHWAGKTFHFEILRVHSAWKASKITDSNAPDVGVTDGGADLSGLFDGQRVSFDIADLLTPVAGGAAWYGLRLMPDGGAPGDEQTIWAAEAEGSQPELEIAYTTAPLPPTELRPSSGHVVSAVRPTLSWRFNSNQPDASQAQAQVQIDTDPAFPDPVWDPGMVDNTAQSVQVGIDLDEDLVYYWRVATRDDAGDDSEFSDAASFLVHPLDAVAITYPTGAIPDSTPTITHTFGGAQARAQWLVLDADGLILHDSGARATADLFYTVPTGVIVREGVTYTAVVRVWDSLDREAVPGDPAYVEAISEFTYAGTSAVPAVDDLTVTGRADPAVDLEWTYPSGAEWFVVLVDDLIVTDGLTPEDLGGGPTYHLRYWRASPGRSHTFEVRGVVDDGGVLKHSSDNVVASIDPSVPGIWIMRPSTGEAVQLWGRDQPDMHVGEDATVFTPAGRSDPVLGVASLRGDEATISGVILDGEGYSADAQAATLRGFKDLVGADEMRAAWGPYNVAILLLPGTAIAARPSGGYDVALPVAQVTESAFAPGDAVSLGFGQSGYGD